MIESFEKFYMVPDSKSYLSENGPRLKLKSTSVLDKAILLSAIVYRSKSMCFDRSVDS